MGRSPLDDDLIERAAQLISSGREAIKVDSRSQSPSPGDPEASAPSHARLARELRDAGIESTLHTYFSGLRAADIDGALSVLDDHHSTSKDVQHVVKQLAAYLRWASITGATQTADGTSIESVAAKLAMSISRRLTGDMSPDAQAVSSSLWPRWHSPDEALGWKRPRHRVADPRIEERNITIAAAAAEREQSAAGEPGEHRTISPETAKALARQFQLSPSAIRAAVAQQADYYALFKVKPELIEGFLRKRVRI